MFDIRYDVFIMRMLFIIFFFIMSASAVVTYVFAQGAPPEILNPFSPCKTVGCVLSRIADFLLTIAAPILVLMVLWGGFLLLTSGGDQKKVEEGRKALQWALIGFAIVLINWGFSRIVGEILGRTTQ